MKKYFLKTLCAFVLVAYVGSVHYLAYQESERLFKHAVVSLAKKFDQTNEIQPMLVDYREANMIMPPKLPLKTLSRDIIAEKLASAGVK